MPPRPPRLLSLAPQKVRAIGLPGGASCSLWRLSAIPRQPASLRSRPSSAFVSSSAVGSSEAQQLEPASRELFESLDGLKATAANYVNLSRLQLALQGVASGPRARVRVAVLGLSDNQESARRLVKVLLADPLSEEGSWEKHLEGLEPDDGRGLLIRYGDVSSLQNSLLPALSVPSQFLKRHNMEILISNIRLNADLHTQGSTGNSLLQDAILVPSLDIPTSANGRLSVVTYPVHKALVFGEGISGAVSYGRYVASQTRAGLPLAPLVKLILGFPAPKSTSRDGDDSDTASITAVDVQLANSAVTKLRQSLENATIYEQGWFCSGMPSLLKWLTSGSTTTEAEKLKPGVRDLIFSLLEETEAHIDQEETSLRNSIAPSRTLESTRRSLHSALALWAERAHTELRGELEIAFSGKRWRLLAWWKLFWRVDDVGMVAEEVLSRRWLIEAEKEIIWLTGRIVESELNKAEHGSHNVEIPSALVAELNPESGLPRTFLDAPGRLPFSELTASNRSEDDQIPLPPLRPWPLDISIARSRLFTVTIPPLQSRAQSLLLQTLSTSALTSALATLLYLSSFSIYESGAVAALGLTWSLRRLQKKWETTKRVWQEEVREDGRRAARETERAVWGVLEKVGRASKVLDGEEERKKARQCLTTAREKLTRLT
ncbi:MAG: hypothetical protein M1840_007506 [Geoglossum simile]|nr:MAG: hypothetical protein M1840_007506 [Geoglossum simile]